eukprot:Em0013g829a
MTVLSLSFPTGYTLADEQSVDTAEAIVEEDSEDEESIQIAPFIPTNEWQVVDDGQSIPPGLHVRINFETGVKEAKLLDPEDKGEADHVTTVDSSDDHRVTADVGVAKATFSDDSKAFKPTGDQRRVHHYGNSDRRGIINKKTKPFTQQELMEAVQKQGSSEEGPIQAITYSAPVRESDGYSDSMPHLHNVHRNPTDVEVMVELLGVLGDVRTHHPESLQALEELEYHVHQLDNARELNSVGGLVVLLRLLNASSDEVRGMAAQVLGSAVQSNPPVQTEVLGYGGLDLLWALVRSEGESESVKKRALFAVGALLRRNPVAQHTFLAVHHGFDVLARKFSGSSPQFQLRAVTLVTDLVSEEQERAATTQGVSPPISWASGWCGHVSSLIYWDSVLGIEKGLQAMVKLEPECDFTVHHNWLRILKDRFGGTGEEDEFVGDILKNCEKLLGTIQWTGEEMRELTIQMREQTIQMRELTIQMRDCHSDEETDNSDEGTDHSDEGTDNCGRPLA